MKDLLKNKKYKSQTIAKFNFMIKVDIEIPNVTYLSEWSALDAALPHGKIIVNKVVCGCGMTDYYLTNNIPVILASPRRELIVSKTRDQRTCLSHYFDRQDSNVTIAQSKQMLKAYLTSPDLMPYGAPKIMCTYDSLHYVVDVLSEMQVLDRFTIVGDEATCIFTDARLKGPKSLDLLYLIDKLPNRCVFITATPLKEIYLDNVPVFQNMQYVTFLWPKDRLMPVTLKRQKMASTVGAITDIIDSYRQNGCFQSKVINGHTFESKEAVFFLNSVSDIVKIVKSAGLSKKNTRIICADDKTNSIALKKHSFEIGHFPSKSEYKTANKTFTFVTKCSFEGADLHSDNCSIYIFADSNRENLNLDISIDLPQIIGRCRTKGNPFRHEIRYFYKTTDSENFNLEEAKMSVQQKIDKTERIVQDMNGCTNTYIIEKFVDAQKAQQYGKDYVDVIDEGNGNYRFESNKLVILSDLRALEIKHEQYKSNYSVLCYLKDNGYDAVDYHAQANTKEARLLQKFDSVGNFEDKMRILCDGCQDEMVRNWVLNCLDIPQKYKHYYGVLGAERCRALNYREANIKREIDFLNMQDRIKSELVNIFKPGESYTLKYIKQTIQSVYDRLSLNVSAKATQLSDYFPNVQKVKITLDDGTRENGLKII